LLSQVTLHVRRIYLCLRVFGGSQSAVANLEASYPPKCPLCGAYVDEQHFERQLTAQQLHQVNIHTAKINLKFGEEFANWKIAHQDEISVCNESAWTSASEVALERSIASNMEDEQMPEAFQRFQQQEFEENDGEYDGEEFLNERQMRRMKVNLRVNKYGGRNWKL
jgi:MoxR-like ATPase